MWREGLAGTALSVDYQRILASIEDRVRLGQGLLTCREIATAFGLDVVPAAFAARLLPEDAAGTGAA